jgi:hypothetical protein
MNYYRRLQEMLMDNIDILETRISTAPYFTCLMGIMLLTSFLGFFIRIYYNGSNETMHYLFNVTTLGVGWGKTPVYMQIICFIASIFLGAFAQNYRVYIKTNGVLSHRLMRPYYSIKRGKKS